MQVNKTNHIKIIKLAQKTIGENGIQRAESSEKGLTSMDQQKVKEAVNTLSGAFESKQKRPIYYLRDEIKQELHHTRSTVLYASMYIEYLVKFYKRDLIKEKKPLGKLLSYINGVEMPGGLKEKIQEYNKVFWVKSKHEVDGYPEDEHLFSLQDAILCCLITKVLADEILKHSECARKYNNGEIIV